VIRLLLPETLAGQMRRWAEAAYPREACGLLLGHRDQGGWVAEEWLPAANVHPEPLRHFELDPATHIATLRRLRAEGGEQRLIGHFHSHPDGEARPSATDLSMAEDPDCLWLILSVSQGQACQMTAWKPLPGQAFQPISLILRQK